MTRLAALIGLCALCIWSDRADAAAPFVPDDPLPTGAILRLGTARLRHPQTITSLALSPDGRILASADHDGLVRLWDTSDGRLRVQLSGAGKMVTFSRDGRMLATAKEGAAARLWDGSTGKRICEVEALSGPAVAFSADGKYLAGGDTESVAVCETATGKVVLRLGGVEFRPATLAFSFDGKALAVGGWKSRTEVVVWDLPSGRVRHRLENKKGGMARTVAFSPDDKTLAVAFLNGTRLYDAKSGDEFNELTERDAYSLAFDNEGRLVTGGDLSVWDLKKVRRPWTANQQALRLWCVDRVAVSVDGSRVASTLFDCRIQLWDGRTGKERQLAGCHFESVGAVAWSLDGKQVATASGGDGTVRLWDARTGAPGRVLIMEEMPDASSRWLDPTMLSFSADGRTLTGRGKRWFLATGEQTALPISEIMAYSTDGKWATAKRDTPLVKIHDVTGRLLHRIPLEKDFSTFSWGPSSLAFSADGQLLAIASRYHREVRPTILLFDVVTGKQVRQLRPDQYGPEGMFFSPDGRWLAVTRSGGPVEVLDALNGEVRCRVELGKGWRSFAWVPLAFSLDGSLFATGDGGGVIHVYETASGEVVRKWDAHEGAVYSLAFSPDGGRLLSGGDDATALVWPVLPAAPKKAWDKRTAERHWAALAKGAEQAYPAIASLIDSQEGIGMLTEKLKPDDEAEANRIVALVTDLDDEEFDTRQRAEAALKVLGRKATFALRQALDSNPSLEQSIRIKRLLANLKSKPTADELRDLRAIQALERIGTPLAETMLENLARGSKSGKKTTAAAAALERLEARRRAARPPTRQEPTGRPPRRMGEHKGEVHAIGHTPDGRTTLTAGRDGKIRRWDLGTSKELTALDAHESGAFALAVSRDGKLLATAGATARCESGAFPVGGWSGRWRGTRAARCAWPSALMER